MIVGLVPGVLVVCGGFSWFVWVLITTLCRFTAFDLICAYYFGV